MPQRSDREAMNVCVLPPNPFTVRDTARRWGEAWAGLPRGRYVWTEYTTWAAPRVGAR
jgi:hypothetical protein